MRTNCLLLRSEKKCYLFYFSRKNTLYKAGIFCQIADNFTWKEISCLSSFYIYILGEKRKANSLIGQEKTQDPTEKSLCYNLDVSSDKLGTADYDVTVIQYIEITGKTKQAYIATILFIRRVHLHSYILKRS